MKHILQRKRLLRVGKLKLQQDFLEDLEIVCLYQKDIRLGSLDILQI